MSYILQISLYILCSCCAWGCDSLMERISKQYAIPSNLLKSISLIESGRYVGGKQTPWPWTVQSEGKSYYFESKTQAIQAVRKLQACGIQNIDVGYMQINLKYHPKAFLSLSEAFEPASNIEYAAKFIKQLYNKTKSWSQAVAQYHSANAHGHGYMQKVYKAWSKTPGGGQSSNQTIIKQLPHNPLESRDASVQQLTHKAPVDYRKPRISVSKRFIRLDSKPKSIQESKAKGFLSFS